MRMVHLGLLALGVAAVFGTVGCGDGNATQPSTSAAELARGRTLFQSGAQPSCGFCHTLGAAETASPLAPNLDEEMREAEIRRISDDQLADRCGG